MVWAEKYRPKTVQQCILPQDMKDKFQKYVDNKDIPNLLLSGSSGVGKTTVAVAMCEELGIEYLIINGSKDGTIDVLRNRIEQFAATVSMDGERKMVILDEADYLSHATQPALRRFIEEYSANCGFIFTCNYPQKIIDPLVGRLAQIDFKVTATEKKTMALEFFKRAKEILEKEGINYDKNAVAQLITKYMPNWRKVINEMQAYSSTGTIDDGILANLSDGDWNKLYDLLKAKNFTEIRKWAGEHSDVDASTVFRKFYDDLAPKLSDDTVPVLILHIADYQFKAAWVADQEVNLVAFFVEVMANCRFK